MTQSLGGHESFCEQERFFSFKSALKGKEKRFKRKVGGTAFQQEEYLKKFKSLYAFGYL